MYFFSRKFSILLLLISLSLLLLPKINLIKVDVKETAGLRLDDLILFFVGILLMWVHILSHQRIYRIEGWILLITIFGIFSFLTNHVFVLLGFLSMDAKILYSIRLLEYFLFFYIGAIAFHHFSDQIVIWGLFLWNLLLMTLQKINLIGGISFLGYQADVSGRVQGVASFPSEMGLLLNLLFCYLIFDENKPRFFNIFQSPFTRHVFHSLYLYSLFCLFGIFIIFTGNRISIIALCICFISRLQRELSLRIFSSYLSMLFLIPLVALAIGFAITQTSGVYHRSADLFSLKNFELFTIVWEKIDINQHPMGHEVVEATNYDMSWWLRIHKWLFMAKSYWQNPECYLQGLGPGYAGAALDGGLLRIFTEYGWVGAFLFWKFFACLHRLNLQTKWMLNAFLINMIFFDAYLAYKTMSFLLFTCGYIFERKNCMAINKLKHGITSKLKFSI